MSKTVVGLFPSTSVAQNVKQTLVSQGYNSSDIRVIAQDHDEDYSGSTTTGTTGTGSNYSGSTAGEGTGIGDKISGFFKSLSGGDDEVHNHYATGVNGGGALLTVKADDDRANTVAALLREHGAHDIEGGTADRTYAGNEYGTGAGSLGSLGTTGTTGTTGTAGYAGTVDNVSGQESIPIVEENLVVGKREVDRGGVRVYSHVVEEPVSADVSLRNETIQVERRPVSRVATAADFAPGDRTIEVRATGEEAVVGKTARVVEEVLVGKEASERTEAIHDSVRRTEVDVEQVAGTETRTGTTTGTGFGTDTTRKSGY